MAARRAIEESVVSTAREKRTLDQRLSLLRHALFSSHWPVHRWHVRDPEDSGSEVVRKAPTIGRAHLGNLQAARHYFVRHAGIRPVASMTVNDVERLEHFAIMSGLAPQSVDAIRPDFPRWVRYMKENGVTEIPDSPLAGHSHAVNMASLLIRQKAGFKVDSIAH
jgi:hypothetical protein